jgi:drug/metabolite transporter (DMT)-like permease
LLLSMPLVAPLAVTVALTRELSGATDAWLGFAYVSLVSMFLGFFAWYAGLARGGVAKIGQVQLAQPVLTLVWAALLLGEHVGLATALAAVAVLASAAAAQRTRVEQVTLGRLERLEHQSACGAPGLVHRAPPPPLVPPAP